MTSLLLSVHLVAILTHQRRISTPSVIFILFFIMLSFAPGKPRYSIIPLLLFLIVLMLIVQLLPPVS